MIDRESVPSEQRRDEIIEEVCKQYGIDREKNTFTASVSNSNFLDRVEYDIKIFASEPGLPIVAALELFMMKMGNIMIYRRVTEYGIVC